MVLNNMMVCDSGMMLETAVRICRGYLNGPWKSITPADISLKRISGGLSNWLYAVRLVKEPQVESTVPASGLRYPRQVLLRLYGQAHQGEAGLESIITESVIFTLLSERNLGPKLYGIFPGGRIEEYIPARPLKRFEMSKPQISLMVADKMAAIHTMNVPITKEPSWIWDTMGRWLANIKDFTNDSDLSVDNRSKAFKQEDYEKLAAEVSWVRNHLSKVSSPVVFCHNDLQGGNILLKEDQQETKPSIVIIDFEYCSYNYRGFDLANHFIEWTYDYSHPTHPGYSVDISNKPSLAHQRKFSEQYLSTVKSLGGRHGDSNVECLLNEIKQFSLASHLFWSLWSFVNARLSQIPFGYEEYAEERLSCYYDLKGELVGGKED